MAILLALVTVLSVRPMSALAANSSFTDVPENAWFYKPVTYMAENGYMSGTSGSKFSPHQTTTRAMFVTVLGRGEQACQRPWRQQIRPQHLRHPRAGRPYSVQLSQEGLHADGKRRISEQGP